MRTEEGCAKRTIEIPHPDLNRAAFGVQINWKILIQKGPFYLKIKGLRR